MRSVRSLRRSGVRPERPPVLDRFRQRQHRLKSAIERHGVRGAAGRALGRTLSKRDQYVWYVLGLDRVEPIPFRGDGYELVLGQAEHVELLRDLPAITVDEGRRRIARGDQIWFVLHDGEPAFVCSAFLQAIPTEPVPGGCYQLPEGVASLDDGFTRREYRGRALAPAAWTAIAERLGEQGLDVLVARAGIENIAARRTHEKCGFRPFTVMTRERRGFQTHVSFDDEPADLTVAERRAADHLRQTLTR